MKAGAAATTDRMIERGREGEGEGQGQGEAMKCGKHGRCYAPISAPSTPVASFCTILAGLSPYFSSSLL